MTSVENRYESSAAWQAVDQYFEETLVREDTALVEARLSTAQSTMPNAEVAPNQGALLALMCRMVGAHRVLEFGTLTGYSTLWFASAVGEQGHVTTLELDQHNADIAMVNLERAGVADRVDVVVGPAGDSAARLIDNGTEPYDLVFIDADKPSNPQYLDAALRLTGPGAVIIIDNVVRDGAVVDAGSDDARVQGVRAVTDMIAAHPDLDATALQTVGLKGWDGLIIARRA